ncbi:hypothetical protein HG530_005768 [Fusarium avenaceum]|nr:hypothetical protein DER45DRAFT_621832 [Fusarium avenaceum]KAI6767759.1 hypothetical protein HG530_005768 [Fusarium avenaceum]
MSTTPGQTPRAVLPNELIIKITKHFSRKDLLNARFVDRYFSDLAASSLFRSVTLSTDPDDIAAFLGISKSEHIRVHVKEIVCDSTHHGTSWAAYLDLFYLLMALPRIRLFRNLEDFTLRMPVRASGNGDGDRTVRTVTRWMLDIAFRCLAGSWTEGVQDIIAKKLSKELRHRFEYSRSPNEFPKTPIPIKTIKLLDLEDEVTDELTNEIINTWSFQTVMNLKSLVSMEIQTERDEWRLRKTYPRPRLMQALDHTWLTPKLASKLQSLSLSSEYPWGYLPKMDFRVIGIEGLENLKVLSLGNYQFSHRWQIEWFGALPIEELRLTNCGVLRSDNNLRERTLEITDTVVQDSKGKIHRFSNEGYYITGSQGGTRHSPPLESHLRWKHFFSHWAESMTNLKFFKIEKHASEHAKYSYEIPRTRYCIDPTSKYRPTKDTCDYFDNGPDFNEWWLDVRSAVRGEAEVDGMIIYSSFVREEERKEDYEALKKLLAVVKERAGPGGLDEAMLDHKGR